MRTVQTDPDFDVPVGETGKKGLLVAPDDLQVGRFYAVYGLKNDPAQTHPIFGQAFKVKAMNLPFLVGEVVSDPCGNCPRTDS